MREWYEKIALNIRLLNLADYPIRKVTRLVEEVGGSVKGWDLENLLDLLFGYKMQS